MYFLSWIMVGLVLGWSAGKILKGKGYGPLMDIAMGICGALAGGFVARSVAVGAYRAAPSFAILFAAVGAVVLTLFAGFVNGRRLYARQL